MGIAKYAQMSTKYVNSLGTDEVGSCYKMVDFSKIHHTAQPGLGFFCGLTIWVMIYIFHGCILYNMVPQPDTLYTSSIINIIPMIQYIYYKQ